MIAPHPHNPSSTRARIPTGVLVFLGFIVLAILCFTFLRPKPSTPSAPAEPPAPEVALTNLTLRNDRLYLPDQTNAFSGWMVEHYPDGVLKSRSAVRDGQLEGPSEGWYTNGVLQVREHFVQGVSHGSRTKWHANGNKASEANITQGQVVGIFRRWRDDGSLAEEISMDRDKPHGISRSYYPSGAIQTEARLDQGQLVDQKTWKDGENIPPSTAAPK